MTRLWTVVHDPTYTQLNPCQVELKGELTFLVVALQFVWKYGPNAKNSLTHIHILRHIHDRHLFISPLGEYKFHVDQTQSLPQRTVTHHSIDSSMINIAYE